MYCEAGASLNPGFRNNINILIYILYRYTDISQVLVYSIFTFNDKICIEMSYIDTWDNLPYYSHPTKPLNPINVMIRHCIKCLPFERFKMLNILFCYLPEIKETKISRLRFCFKLNNYDSCGFILIVTSTHTASLPLFLDNVSFR